MSDEQKLRLLDLIDLDFLQRFQDAFAKTANVASIMVDDEGSITKPSNFTDFCIKYTRGTTLGLKKCIDCDIHWGKIAAKKQEPVIYKCHTGLTDFAVPIVIAGKHIASILGGQVLTAPPDEKHFRKIAQELGIEVEAYLNEVRKIKIVSEEMVEAAAQLLYIVANSISEIAHKNLELKKKSEREKLYQNITESIRVSLNTHGIKEKMVNLIGKALDADRCFFMQYDDKNDNFYTVDYEYTSSKKIPNYIGANVNEDVPNFMSELKKGSRLLIDNKKIFINGKLQDYEIENRIIERLGVISAYAVSIIYDKKLYGVLGLHYLSNNHLVSEDELALLKSLVNQLAGAFYQAELYERTQKQVEREALLRKITEKIRSSLNLEETISFICEGVAKLFAVQRVAVSPFPVKGEYEKFIVTKEYITKDHLEGVQQSESFLDIAEYWGKKVLETDKPVAFNDILNSETPDYFKNTYSSMGVKSIVGAPIKKGNNYWGMIVLSEYENIRIWTDEEKSLLEAVAAQVFIAINQAELYDKQKKNAKREFLIRTISERIRSSLDFKETLHFIVEEVAKALDVQRAVLAWYSIPNEYNYRVLIEEYKQTENLQGIQQRENYTEISKFWTATIMKRKSMIAFDDIENSDTPNFFKNAYKEMGVKSIICVPIKNGNDIFGNLVLSEYRYRRSWTTEEKEILELISGQIYTAIYQTQLFENQKQVAKREELLRKATEIIRSTIDLDETLTIICDSVSNLFNVERATIVEFYDKSDFSKWRVRREYKKRSDILGLSDVDFDLRAGAYNGEIVMNKGINLVIDNIETADVPEFYKENYLKMGVKSILSVPIKSGNSKFGGIFLSSVDNYHFWTKQDIELLENIAAQIYIAIQQAELFEKEKKNAERQKLISSVFSQVLSTLSIEQLRPIVEDIGNMMKADRCYFVETNLEKMGGKSIELDWEYLSSPDIKSITGYQFDPDEVRKFVEIYLSVKDVKTFNYEQIIQENKDEYFGIIKYAKRFNLKSGIGVPFFYANKLKAVLCIEYVKENLLPSEDEMDFLRILGAQVGLAYSQIRNYQDAKTTAERETVLRKVIEALRVSLDINVVKKTVVTLLGEIFNADRCYFRSYDAKANKILPPDVEYLASDSMQSLINVEPDQNALKYFVDLVKKENKRSYPVLVDREFAKGTPLESYLESVNIKADYAIPIVDRRDELNWLVLHYIEKDPKFDEDTMKLLETIGYQIDIAFEQIRLYNNAQKKANRERLLRKIYETMRSSLDPNTIKSTIVNEVGPALGADMCFVSSYREDEDSFHVDEYSEYRSSEDLYSLINHSSNDYRLKKFAEVFKNKPEIVYYDVESFISENNLYGTPEEEFLRNIKNTSGYGFSLKYANKTLGFMSLLYIDQYKLLDDEDLDFLRTIATQAGIAIYQANLYKITQLQAEREKISKNIIEILRSSLDKNIIKHLFVKNIGKFFNADRVFFSDYDKDLRVFLPVENNAEYLSSPDVQSFSGYDLTGESTREYIQPLLEKRELNIFCWEEYIRNNTKSYEFIKLFEDFKVKSSYNLPVLYQGEIMGYFCIEFTHGSCHKLSDEDINRIRSMCTQAGIALYHADLYNQAQENTRIQAEFMANTAKDCIPFLTSICELTGSLLSSDISKEEQSEKIIKINQIATQMLEKVTKCSQGNM